MDTPASTSGLVPVTNPHAAEDAAAINVTPSLSLDGLNKLKAFFPAERWQKIASQADKHAANLQELCTRLLATSAARHPDNEQAALCSAGNRLLLAVGSVLKPEDAQRYEDALKGISAAPAAVLPVDPAAVAVDVPADETLAAAKKRGGKADAAPPPVS